MDSNITSDDVIGYGIIDLDPYLNSLKLGSPPASEGGMNSSKAPQAPQKTNLRCFLNFERKQAGFVLFQASFKEEKTDIVHFRFETAELQRSTKTFGDMDKLYVKVTGGEEILQTQKSKDTS